MKVRIIKDNLSLRGSRLMINQTYPVVAIFDNCAVVLNDQRLKCAVRPDEYIVIEEPVQFIPKRRIEEQEGRTI